MSPKAHSKKSRRQTHKWAIVTVILALAIILLVYASLQHPTAVSDDNTDDVPQGLKTLANHYMDVMHNLNSSQTKTEMASRINGNYNQTQLFTWEKNKLTFEQDTTGWYEDPVQILDSGKGICVQHSIVYVAACLARGYQSRLVVAVDTTAWSFIHTWAEDYYNGIWVHVDPSDGVWNNPSYYHNPSWEQSWGKDVGSNVKIYAFMDGSYLDVTSVYSAK
jgi:hypothetical protein